MTGVTPRGARALVGLSVLVSASTLFLRLADPDLFGHIAAGRWMVAHRAVLEHDPFSYASAGPVRYTAAVSEVLFHLVDRVAGAVGLNIVHVLLTALLLVLVLLRAAGSAAARVLVVALVLVSSFSALTLKPQVFSYLLFAWLLLFLDRAPSWPPRRLFVLPLAFVLWANLHRGGVFGIPILVVTAVAFALHEETRGHARALAAVTVFSTLALLVNSGGVYYFTSAFDIVNRASFHARIAEWQPLSLDIVWQRHAGILPLLLLALVDRALSRRRVDAELLCLGLTLLLATKGARLLPFVAIAAAPAAARAIDAVRARVAAHARPALFDGLLVVIGYVTPLVHYERTVPRGYRGLGVCDDVVPVAMTDFLAAHRPEGPLFHSFDFGGYLLYRLAPETKVLIDGRNDTVYDDAFFEAATDAERSPAAFAELERRYPFSTAAFRWNRFGDSRGAFLAASPDWVMVYWDDLSVVYVHRLRDPQMADALGYRALRVDTVQTRTARPLDGADDAVLMTELRRNVREAPASARAHFVLSAALRTRGGEDEARSEQATAERLMAERGD
jgi:hypothetical protein